MDLVPRCTTAGRVQPYRAGYTQECLSHLPRPPRQACTCLLSCSTSSPARAPPQHITLPATCTSPSNRCAGAFDQPTSIAPPPHPTQAQQGGTQGTQQRPSTSSLASTPGNESGFNWGEFAQSELPKKLGILLVRGSLAPCCVTRHTGTGAVFTGGRVCAAPWCGCGRVCRNHGSWRAPGHHRRALGRVHLPSGGVFAWCVMLRGFDVLQKRAQQQLAKKMYLVIVVHSSLAMPLHHHHQQASCQPSTPPSCCSSWPRPSPA